VCSVRRLAEIFRALLGCNVIALIVAFILAGISESGAVAMQITHVLFWTAFIISVVAATLEAWLFFESTKHAIAAFVLTVIIVGGGLWWLSSKLSQMKAAQDAANKLPPPLPANLVNIPGPNVAMVKTPKFWLTPPAPTNQVSGTGNIVGNTVKGKGNNLIGGITQGPGSIAQIGGTGNTATVINGPKILEMSEQQIRNVAKHLVAFSGETVEIDVDRPNQQTINFANALQVSLKLARISSTVNGGTYIGGCLSYPGVSFMAGVNKQALVQAIWTALVDEGVVDKADPIPGCSRSGEPDEFHIYVRPNG